MRILAGPFEGHLGLYAGMRAHERVLVLLALLGGSNGWSCPRPTSRPCAPEGMVRLDVALAVDQRDAFLQEVADALQGCAEIGPGTVLLIASILAGWLWDAFGPTATFLAGAVFSGCAALLMAIYLRARQSYAEFHSPSPDGRR